MNGVVLKMLPNYVTQYSYIEPQRMVVLISHSYIVFKVIRRKTIDLEYSNYLQRKCILQL